MVKARALKKRYIAFEYRGADAGMDQLKRSIYAEALRFFGEYGLSSVALKLVEYLPEKRVGLLRCERGKLDEVLGFLALVSSLDGKPARLVALRSSGTIRSLHESLSLGPLTPKEKAHTSTHRR